MKKLWLAASGLILSACSSTTELYVNHLESNAQGEGYVERTLTLNHDNHHSQVHYWDNLRDSHDTVILIHGVGGDGLSNWQSAMLALGGDYRVLVPDILWYGQSTSDLQPTLDDQVSVMAEFIQKQNIKGNVHLVGHSYGGFIVYGLLANYDLAASATFISSPGGAFEKKDLDALTARFAITKPSDLFVPKNDSELKRLINATSQDPLYLPAFAVEGFYERYFANHSEQKKYMLDNLIDSREQLVANFSHKALPPTQVIWGENDRIFPLEAGMLLAKQCQSPMYIVTDSAHNILLEKPETVNRILSAFLSEHSSIPK